MEPESIRDIFYNHRGNLIHKWDHYFDIYEKYFASYRGKVINILEIGISHGGSLQLWKKYFGEHVHIYAIDINPDCKKLEEENTTIFIGSQEDKVFLQYVADQIPIVDFIIDDGGHTMQQQLLSFEMLFMKVKEGGAYLVEDTHTSYWDQFHGGLRNPGSFIEKSKSLVDSLYDHHVMDKSQIRIDEITQHINCIAFYDSIVVFEKKLRKQPFHKQIGKKTITPYISTSEKQPEKETFLSSLKALFVPKKDTIHPFDANDGGIDEIK
ncbi:class I SAM-dependent methyltransferase [Dyadobacter luteus]|uniref:Class I SAM-dependent methyltransferase n=1 Tax=Dyadobacter luteus TaxID=2259619 RepID=A0A3D8YBZ6_9BACT|nr:class I SAM-dependent methyltransferase [Dyadobacter luteus]REA61688.1 class I SAM-dependent methyltransferase [Dyadobacter luteus]